MKVVNEEIATVRDAMRGLHRMVEELGRGDYEKVVLMHRGRMVAVVMSAERYEEMER